MCDSVLGRIDVKQVAFAVLFSSVAMAADTPVDVMLGAAESNLRAGKLDRAELMLKQAHESYPSDGRVDLDYGLLYAQREHAKDAVAAFTTALRKNPELRDAYLNLALQNDVMKDYDAADAAYRAGTKRFPADLELWSEWGTTLILAKRYGDAEKALRQALALHAKDGQVTSDLAYAVLQQKRSAEAVKLYESAFASGFSEPDVRRQYGDALAATGELKRAEQIYTELLAKQPASRELLFRRAKVRRALGDAAGASADDAAMKQK
jgi:tetratricopeptide (TPR) repeat protein